MNADALKARIGQKAKATGITHETYYQHIFLRRFLARLAETRYKDHFILKGGMLVSGALSMEARSTMDIDVSVRRLPIDENTAREIMQTIIDTDVGDGVRFDFHRIEVMRPDDEYEGYRISLAAIYETMNFRIKIDVSVGDVIVPGPVHFDFTWDDDVFGKTIEVRAYPIEMVLAEKLETVLSRGDENTRMRDYYDIHVLSKVDEKKVNHLSLGKSLNAVFRQRGTLALFEERDEVLAEISESQTMRKRFKNYCREYAVFTGDLTFDAVMETIRNMFDEVESYVLR